MDGQAMALGDAHGFLLHGAGIGVDVEGGGQEELLELASGLEGRCAPGFDPVVRYCRPSRFNGGPAPIQFGDLLRIGVDWRAVIIQIMRNKVWYRHAALVGALLQGRYSSLAQFDSSGLRGHAKQ